MISTFNIPTKRLNLVQESEIRRLYLIYKLHFFLLFVKHLDTMMCLLWNLVEG